MDEGEIRGSGKGGGGRKSSKAMMDMYPQGGLSNRWKAIQKSGKPLNQNQALSYHSCRISGYEGP
jgi:hypothetical protein